MTLTLRAAAAVTAALFAVPAFAQTPAAPAAGGIRPASPGPTIAGVCVMDEQGVIARSNAGQAYVRRLRELGQQVETELRPQQTALQTEVTALERLPADQRATRQQALQTRANTFQTLASTRQRELQATQEQQLRRIASEMQPVVAQVYAQRGCGLMLDASAVVYANPAMNVTDAVLAGLNTRLPTLTFNRASAPAAPAATAPATRR